jgi:hypothetical protein
MQRTLEPELLDSLPHDHPDALHNRRDLRLTNRVLGYHRWFVRALPRIVRPGEPILELGAGCGELGLRLARAGLAIDGLDLWPRPRHWPEARAWHVADLRTFSGYDAYPVVIANLVLHQFPASDLANLGRRLRANCRAVIALEPARRRVSQVLFRAIAPLLGANHVSLHDAHVSIGSGFCNDELAVALGFNGDDWDVQCTTTTAGACRLVAIRR